MADFKFSLLGGAPCPSPLQPFMFETVPKLEGILHLFEEEGNLWHRCHSTSHSLLSGRSERIS